MDTELIASSDKLLARLPEMAITFTEGDITMFTCKAISGNCPSSSKDNDIAPEYMDLVKELGLACCTIEIPNATRATQRDNLTGQMSNVAKRIYTALKAAGGSTAITNASTVIVDAAVETVPYWSKLDPNRTESYPAGDYMAIGVNLALTTKLLDNIYRRLQLRLVSWNGTAETYVNSLNFGTDPDIANLKNIFSTEIIGLPDADAVTKRFLVELAKSIKSDIDNTSNSIPDINTTTCDAAIDTLEGTSFIYDNICGGAVGTTDVYTVLMNLSSGPGSTTVSDELDTALADLNSTLKSAPSENGAGVTGIEPNSSLITKSAQEDSVAKFDVLIGRLGAETSIQNAGSSGVYTNVGTTNSNQIHVTNITDYADAVVGLVSKIKAYNAVFYADTANASKPSPAKLDINTTTKTYEFAAGGTSVKQITTGGKTVDDAITKINALPYDESKFALLGALGWLAENTTTPKPYNVVTLSDQTKIDQFRQSMKNAVNQHVKYTRRVKVLKKSIDKSYIQNAIETSIKLAPELPVPTAYKTDQPTLNMLPKLTDAIIKEPDFYKQFLEIVSVTAIAKLLVEDLSTTTNLTNWRINFLRGEPDDREWVQKITNPSNWKVQSGGNNYIRITYIMPNHASIGAGDVWVTKTAKLSSADAKKLSSSELANKIFSAIYAGDANVVIGSITVPLDQDAIKSKIKFRIDTPKGKLININFHDYMDMATRMGISSPGSDAMYFDTPRQIRLEKKHAWNAERQDNGTYKYYFDNKDGTKNFGDEDDFCIFLSDATKAQCDTILKNCLIDGKLEECLKFIKDIEKDKINPQMGTLIENIKKINPLRAYVLLKKLGFCRETDTRKSSSLGFPIYMVCSVDSWWKKLKAGELESVITFDATSTIADSAALVSILDASKQRHFSYLHVLVEWVNVNYHVLNNELLPPGHKIVNDDKDKPKADKSYNLYQHMNRPVESQIKDISCELGRIKKEIALGSAGARPGEVLGNMVAARPGMRIHFNKNIQTYNSSMPHTTGMWTQMGGTEPFDMAEAMKKSGVSAYGTLNELYEWTKNMMGRRDLKLSDRSTKKITESLDQIKLAEESYQNSMGRMVDRLTLYRLTNGKFDVDITDDQVAAAMTKYSNLFDVGNAVNRKTTNFIDMIQIMFKSILKKIGDDKSKGYDVASQTF
jgi:hypothetical protein